MAKPRSAVQHLQGRQSGARGLSALVSTGKLPSFSRALTLQGLNGTIRQHRMGSTGVFNQLGHPFA